MDARLEAGSASERARLRRRVATPRVSRRKFPSSKPPPPPPPARAEPTRTADESTRCRRLWNRPRRRSPGPGRASSRWRRRRVAPSRRRRRRTRRRSPRLGGGGGGGGGVRPGAPRRARRRARVRRGVHRARSRRGRDGRVAAAEAAEARADGGASRAEARRPRAAATRRSPTPQPRAPTPPPRARTRRETRRGVTPRASRGVRGGSNRGGGFRGRGARRRGRVGRDVAAAPPTPRRRRARRLETLRARLSAHDATARATERKKRRTTREKRRRRVRAARTETAKLAGERRAATTPRAARAAVGLEGRVRAGRELAAARGDGGGGDDRDRGDERANGGGTSREETRDALRAARGDASSAAAATLEMEKRVRRRVGPPPRRAWTRGGHRLERVSVDASPRTRGGGGGARGGAEGARDASREAEGRGDASGRDGTPSEARERRRRRRAPSGGGAAGTRGGRNDSAAALGAAADAEKRADRWRDRVDKFSRGSSRRGAPSRRSWTRPISASVATRRTTPSRPRKTRTRPSRRIESLFGGLVILRATLRGHPCGEDVDVTASVRRRAATTGPSVGDFHPRKHPRDAPPRTVARGPRRAFANGDFDETDHRHEASAFILDRRHRLGRTLMSTRRRRTLARGRATKDFPRRNRHPPRANPPRSSPSGACARNLLFGALRFAPTRARRRGRRRAGRDRRVLDAEANAAEARARRRRRDDVGGDARGVGDERRVRRRIHRGDHRASRRFRRHAERRGVRGERG